MATVVDIRQAAEAVHQKSTAFSIFLIVFIIVLFFITVVFAFNAAFFAEIRKTGCPAAVSTAEAEVMFWLNVILAVLSGILVLVGVFLFFFARTAPQWTERHMGAGAAPIAAVTAFRDPQTFAEKQAQITELQRQVTALQAQLRGQAASEAVALRAFAT